MESEFKPLHRCHRGRCLCPGQSTNATPRVRLKEQGRSHPEVGAFEPSPVGSGTSLLPGDLTVVTVTARLSAARAASIPLPVRQGPSSQPGPRLSRSPGHPSFHAPEGAGLGWRFAGVGGVPQSQRENVGGALASTKRYLTHPGCAICGAGGWGEGSPLPGSTEPRRGNPVHLASSCPRGPQTRAAWESTSWGPGCWGSGGQGHREEGVCVLGAESRGSPQAGPDPQGPSAEPAQ